MVRRNVTPDKVREYRRREHAKRRQRRLDLIRLLGGKCKVCGETDVAKLELDHIYPVNVNGNRSHTWQDVLNLQVLCYACNVRKGDKAIRY